ncbi:hypothetical protein [Rhizobium mesoamericanum]|uniref:Uncharacterized protein n=1 Tax=Rhizobium mesoamericanum STM3625 TaxID=1211777 RepID=K0PXB7_9HYPH|nr:hypothetical protein [Rhizobium mesoamericanum]CCM76255.1 hypothetical protein BN77_0046 [Rhizobium mesoamericanum STM3625]
MTFNRFTAIASGHKLYTSSKTLKAWGAGGPRALMAANDNYETRGKPVTWPAVAGDWTTALPAATATAAEREPQQPKQHWLDGRLCRFPKTITGGKWGRPVGAPPANDNTPRRNVVRLPNDGPTSEWLAERNAAGFAVDYGQEGNRIERALVKEASPLVGALRQVTELMRPPVIAANDNEPANDDGEAVNAGKGHERAHNQGSITPSIPMLLKAYEDGMDSGVREVRDGWHRIGSTDGKRKLTGLIFLNGELIAYGDNKGRKRRPDYNTKIAEAVVDQESETAKHVAAQPAENRTYVRLAGRERYISSQRPDAPGSIAPAQRTARAAANDNELQAAIANTPVMPPVKKLPDGVAAEYGRLAGVAEAKGVGEGKSSAPMHDALSELERQEELAAAGFHAEDLVVVESIMSDASFRTIGLQHGYAESSAHRMGRKVVEGVLTRISEKIAA